MSRTRRRLAAGQGLKANLDFRRLWLGATISQLGSAVSTVALPVVALTVVNATPLQVSALAAISAVTTALLAFSIGAEVEHRPKRPVMIWSDFIRFAALVTIPVAALLHTVTFTHLCAVAAITAACQIAYNAAATAHLKALVSGEHLLDANGRLQSTLWLNLTIGPFVGGSLVQVLTAPFTLVVDALSFLVNALVIRRIRQPEPAIPARDRSVSRWHDLSGGLRFAWQHRTLRMLLLSWVIFAGANFMTTPLNTLFYLRDLRFSALQYGLVMGLPSLFGFFGARLTSRVAGRFGSVKTLWLASLLRSPWFFLTPLARPGAVGLAICVAAFSGVLFFAAMANSAMATYRQMATPDGYQSRVATLWAFATVVAQPPFALLAGLIAGDIGVRPALVAAAALMAGSVALLPRRDAAASETPQTELAAQAPAR